MSRDTDNAKNEIKELEARVERYETALKIYADKRNWDMPANRGPQQPFDAYYGTEHSSEKVEGTQVAQNALDEGGSE